MPAHNNGAFALFSELKRTSICNVYAYVCCGVIGHRICVINRIHADSSMLCLHVIDGAFAFSDTQKRDQQRKLMLCSQVARYMCCDTASHNSLHKQNTYPFDNDLQLQAIKVHG